MIFKNHPLRRDAPDVRRRRQFRIVAIQMPAQVMTNNGNQIQSLLLQTFRVESVYIIFSEYEAAFFFVSNYSAFF